MKRLAALAFLVAAFLPIAVPAASLSILTPSSATACTSIASTARQLLSIWNASSSAQTATLSVYDEPASPTCASGDLLFSVVLTANQVFNFPVMLDSAGGWLRFGLAYKLSAAATNNVVILYQ
jgi:hypothetical protein